jgi:succinate dehydrogenase / fumarate reductase membrane anchor subunit
MSKGQSSTALGKVRGLGSAHHGGNHWLAERFSSVALLLLGLWFLASLVMLPDLSRPTLLEWLRQPVPAVLMGLLVVSAFAHGLDGLKVVVDDYVHDEGSRIGVGFALTMLAIFGGALALLALAKIALGA